MKRPACALAIVAMLALPMLIGCARHPLTDSEFRGFCYTIQDRWASCDTINICNDFDTNVMSAQHPSQPACLKACDEVYNRLYEPNFLTGCGNMLRKASDWCYKYCQDNYPK